MKRTPLLNRHLSALIATLWHLDEIVVCDAGLPAPPGVPVIDLAIVAGLPNLRAVLNAVLLELRVEGMAPGLMHALRSDLGDGVACVTISHNALKRRCAAARAIVRTGETMPYANVFLVCGVTF